MHVLCGLCPGACVVVKFVETNVECASTKLSLARDATSVLAGSPVEFVPDLYDETNS